MGALGVMSKESRETKAKKGRDGKKMKQQMVVRLFVCSQIKNSAFELL